MAAWHEWGKERPCTWWGHFLRYPIHNIRRVWRVHHGYYD